MIRDPQGALFALYKSRRELWAIALVLTHCRRGPYVRLRRMVWNALSEEDRQIIEDAWKGKAPK